MILKHIRLQQPIADPSCPLACGVGIPDFPLDLAEACLGTESADPDFVEDRWEVSNLEVVLLELDRLYIPLIQPASDRNA